MVDVTVVQTVEDLDTMKVFVKAVMKVEKKDLLMAGLSVDKRVALKAQL